jgi:hypothetical protein
MDPEQNDLLNNPPKEDSQTGKPKLSIYQIIGLFILSNICVIGILLLIYWLF